MALTDNEQLEYSKCVESVRYFIDTYVNLNHIGEEFALTERQSDTLNLISSNQTTFIDEIERGTGITSIVCVFLLWYITFNPNKTIMITSHNSNCVRHSLNLLLTLADKLPQYLKPIMVSRAPSRLLFNNGTQLLTITATENSVRGVSVDIIYIDNYRKIRNEQFALFFEACVPTSAKIICTQTG